MATKKSPSVSPEAEIQHVMLICVRDCRIAGIHYLPGDEYRVTPEQAEVLKGTGCFK